MKKTTPNKRMLLFIIGMMLAPQLAPADVEWTSNKQLSVDGAPKDIAASPDGQWLYVLTAGEVLVYSSTDNEPASRIPVDKSYDRLIYSAPGNTLILSSSRGKTVKFIQLEITRKFSVDGLAFKGPENAPVTIAIFSDYQ